MSGPMADKAKAAEAKAKGNTEFQALRVDGAEIQ